MPNETRLPQPPGDPADHRDDGGDARAREPRRRRPRRGGGDRPAPASADGPQRDDRPAGPRRPRDRGPQVAPDEDVVVVRFKGQRRSYFHNRQGVAVTTGSYCLVEADRGRDLGRVAFVGRGPAAWWAQAAGQGVLALATPDDLVRLHAVRGDELRLRAQARERIVARGLDMNLVDVERQYDNRKITFYFTAEQRVDFRQLVRDLASMFRTRIELRQIGVRDEARNRGGLGLCGREFCCSSFLHEFAPVTLKMAKVQQLPLNPAKLSGPCGRLRCCLTYEHEVYQDLRRSLPKVGARVATPRGDGVVRKLDLLGASVAVLVDGVDGLPVFRVADVTWSAGDALPKPRAGEPRGGCDGGCEGGCGRRPKDDA